MVERVPRIGLKEGHYLKFGLDTIRTPDGVVQERDWLDNTKTLNPLFFNKLRMAPAANDASLSSPRTRVASIGGENARMSDEETLAYILLSEAGGEGARGMEAVAHVILNRTLSGTWGDSMIAVATQKNKKGVYQFTGANPAALATVRKTYSTKSPEFKTAINVLRGVTSGQLVDFTGGAKHYYANKGAEAIAEPSWFRKVAVQGGVQIGNHLFAAEDRIAPSFGVTTLKRDAEPAFRVVEEQAWRANVRKQPISAELRSVLTTVGQELDVMFEVVSGGQRSDDPNKIGHRHDEGGAADLRMFRVVNGEKVYIPWNTPEGQALWTGAVARAYSLGAKGIGAAEDYMGVDTVHIGFGSDWQWGKTYKDKPDDPPAAWVTDAVAIGKTMPPADIPALKAAGWLAGAKARDYEMWAEPVKRALTLSGGIIDSVRSPVLFGDDAGNPDGIVVNWGPDVDDMVFEAGSPNMIDARIATLLTGATPGLMRPAQSSAAGRSRDAVVRQAQGQNFMFKLGMAGGVPEVKPISISRPPVSGSAGSARAEGRAEQAIQRRPAPVTQPAVGDRAAELRRIQAATPGGAKARDYEVRESSDRSSDRVWGGAGAYKTGPSITIRKDGSTVVGPQAGTTPLPLGFKPKVPPIITGSAGATRKEAIAEQAIQRRVKKPALVVTAAPKLQSPPVGPTRGRGAAGAAKRRLAQIKAAGAAVIPELTMPMLPEVVIPPQETAPPPRRIIVVDPVEQRITGSLASVRSKYSAEVARRAAELSSAQGSARGSTFTGVATKSTFTVGQAYVNSMGDPIIAQADGSFINARTGQVTKGSSQTGNYNTGRGYNPNPNGPDHSSIGSHDLSNPATGSVPQATIDNMRERGYNV